MQQWRHSRQFNQWMGGHMNRKYEVKPEWTRQALVVYGGLIGIGVVILQALIPAQSLERSRMRRSLRPQHGQLWRLRGGLRVRLRRPQWAHAVCSAAGSGAFQMRFYVDGGVGELRAADRAGSTERFGSTLEVGGMPLVSRDCSWAK